MPVSSASRNVWTVSRMSGKICKGEDIKVKGNHSLPIIPLCTCSSVPSQESEASSSPPDTSPGVPRPRETVLTVGMWSIIPFFEKKLLASIPVHFQSLLWGHAAFLPPLHLCSNHGTPCFANEGWIKINQIEQSGVAHMFIVTVSPTS